MVEVIARRNLFQKTKNFFISLGTKNTVSLAFVLIMGGGFLVTYSMLSQQQDVRQRAAETDTLLSYSGTPFNNVVRNLPGTVNMVDFDNGGEGVAYHDSESTNSDNAYGGITYRTPDTGVDTANSYAGATSLKIVTQVIEGEWLKYTVNIPTPGTYTFSSHILAPGDGSIFHVEVDGKDVTGPISYANTNGVFTTVSKDAIFLTSGKHIIKIVFDKNGTRGGLGQWDTFSFK